MHAPSASNKKNGENPSPLNATSLPVPWLTDTIQCNKRAASTFTII